MDEISVEKKHLAQLFKLSSSGKKQELATYLKKFVRSIARTDPLFANSLAELIPDEPSDSSTFVRGESVERLPVDLDSRMELGRIEHPVLDIEPIWQGSIRAQLEQVVAERRRIRELTSANVPPTRSVLFTGAPGLGKTLAAKWMAHKLDLPLLTLDLASVMSSFLGRTGNNIRNILDYAKSTDCILFLDELDAIAKRRDDATEVGELKRLVTVLLQEIDNWPVQSLMLAATNHPDLLDPVIWRRFDMVIEFPLPSEESIARVLRTSMDDVDIEKGFIDVLPIIFSGLSFSDIHRYLAQVKRQSILSDTSLNEGLYMVIKERIDALPKAEKILLAQKLTDARIGQRIINSLTGLSRDTIRKYTQE